MAHVRYSGPFLKWTGKEHKQIDQKTRKLITIQRALHLRIMFIDYMYEERREEEDLPALKIALTNRYKDSRTT